MESSMGLFVAREAGRLLIWWQGISNVKKTLLIGIPILILIAIVAIVTTIALSDKGKVKYNEKMKEIATLFGKSIDAFTNPCDNFYKFTCGNWLKNIDETWKKLERVTNFDIIGNIVSNELLDALEQNIDGNSFHSPSAKQNIIRFYHSCVNADAKETKQAIIKELTGLPEYHENWHIGIYSLERIIANSIVKFASPIPISVRVNNTKEKNGITLEPCSYKCVSKWFGLPLSISKNIWDMDELIFKRRLEKLLEIPTTTNEEKLLLANYNLYMYEKIQANGKSVNVAKYRISDLKSVFPGIDYGRIIELITEALGLSIRDDEEISVLGVAALKDIAQSINNNISLSTAVKLIGTDILNSFILNTDSRLNNRSEIEKDSQKVNSKVCVDYLVENFGDVIDKVYADHIGTREKSSKMILEIILYLKNAFETLARESTWIDASTLNEVIDKLHAMKDVVKYEDWILDDEKLDATFHNLPTMNSSYLANIRGVAKFRIGFRKDEYIVPDDSRNTLFKGHMLTSEVNAFYVRHKNSIFFPLSIRRVPLYYEDLPYYLNFGAFGSVVGHEITHGFDTEGAEYDKNGNRRNWWTNDTKKEFEKKTKCFVDQYGRYYDNQTKMHVDGVTTLRENVADNGGLRQSFLAYRNWVSKHEEEPPLPGLNFSPNQLFFISYSIIWCSHFTYNWKLHLMTEDEHTMPPYRVWGAVSNSKDFAQAFNCTVGSKMNPEDKCIIW